MRKNGVSRTLLIEGLLAAGVFLLAAAFAAGTAQGGGKRAGSVDARVLESGGNAAFSERAPSIEVFTERGAFESFHAAVHMNVFDAPERPEVDFGRGIAVYVSYGRKSTGGYSIEILGARVHRRSLVITAQLLKPLPDSFLTQQITHPYVILGVPLEELDRGRVLRVELRDERDERLDERRLR